MNASFHCLDKWSNQTVETGTRLPNEVYETLHYYPSVMAWCNVPENEVIGPYIFENEDVFSSTYKRIYATFCFKDYNYILKTLFSSRVVLPDIIHWDQESIWTEINWIHKWEGVVELSFLEALHILRLATSFYGVKWKIKCIESNLGRWPNSRQRFLRQFRLYIKRH